MSINTIIDKLGMVPHPEGGWFVETYRSKINVTSGPENAVRSASTAIYFLICPGNCSRLHRIKSDEVWHFYGGDPLTIVELDIKATEQHRLTLLGSDLFANQHMQHTVSAGTWFGCYSGPLRANANTIETSHGYSLVGCTVAPGFDFSDFELASHSKLMAEYPQAHSVVEKLTEGLP